MGNGVKRKIPISNRKQILSLKELGILEKVRFILNTIFMLPMKMTKSDFMPMLTVNIL